MSAVYNPQADLMAEIERLELECRELRVRLDQTTTPADRKVLEKQLKETKEAIVNLQKRLD